ncbi:hypothetical protein FGO68_gene9521 [Halteria grandinella]|uniref:Uncharacterized protein n=1 Tax=Halteria grandinella TaxID=5974 RepID=A0A8J8NSL2_HALGN|nr:hypothetical protein FGO68_gene9521 [Halteria grandinella]
MLGHCQEKLFIKEKKEQSQQKNDLYNLIFAENYDEFLAKFSGQYQSEPLFRTATEEIKKVLLYAINPNPLNRCDINQFQILLQECKEYSSTPAVPVADLKKFTKSLGIKIQDIEEVISSSLGYGGSRLAECQVTQLLDSYAIEMIEYLDAIVADEGESFIKLRENLNQKDLQEIFAKISTVCPSLEPVLERRQIVKFRFHLEGIPVEISVSAQQEVYRSEKFTKEMTEDSRYWDFPTGIISQLFLKVTCEKDALAKQVGRKLAEVIEDADLMP